MGRGFRHAIFFRSFVSESSIRDAKIIIEKKNLCCCIYLSLTFSGFGEKLYDDNGKTTKEARKNVRSVLE